MSSFALINKKMDKVWMTNDEPSTPYEYPTYEEALTAAALIKEQTKEDMDPIRMEHAMMLIIRKHKLEAIRRLIS